MMTTVPIGEYASVHGKGCPGDCGGVYQCNRCERWVGYCLGGADDTPGICDDCLLVIGHVEDE